MLGWFPVIGGGGDKGLIGQLHHLALPAFTVGLGWVGYLARIVRASMLEVLAENHVRHARAHGLSQNRIQYQYVLRIAILPAVTIIGIGIGAMLSGVVFAEIIFARPGLGKLIFVAVQERNFPLIMGTVLVTTSLFVHNWCEIRLMLFALGCNPLAVLSLNAFCFSFASVPIEPVLKGY